MFAVALVTCLFVPPAPVSAEPPLPADAEALVKALNDADAAKRLAAIRSLGFKSQTVRRTAGTRDQICKPFDAAVPGLVPHLVRALEMDASDENRAELVTALADTRAPEAVAALRKGLGDKSATVRLAAACALTEFDDATGIAEMKKGLARLRASADWPAVGAYEVQRLLAAFERVTGKSMGECRRTRTRRRTSKRRRRTASGTAN
jgi:HEAT repeat protein